MAKKPDKSNKVDQKKAVGLNKLFGDTISKIASSIGTSSTNSTQLDAINSTIDRIIAKELDSTKSITSDDMSTFLVKLFNDMDRNNSGYETKDFDEIFTNDSSGLFNFFQERYRNKNLLYEDLGVITSQLFELEEAVMTTRDAVITADDLTKTVSRTIRFNDESNSDTTQTYLKAIEKLEEDLRIPSKLKNLVVPYTLTFGKYFVYVCPYAKLFEQQYKRKVQDSRFYTTVGESIDESFVKEIKDWSVRGTKITSGISEIEKIAKEHCSNIEIYNDEFSIPLLEGADLTGLLSDENFKKMSNAAVKKSGTQTRSFDGVVDTSKVDDMFKDQTGCYIKYIDPKKIIPVTILDTTIGYYYIHDVDFEVSKSPFSTSIRVSAGQSSNVNSDLDTMFISKVADSIVKSFDKKFLENNGKFKDLILNALTYNDLYKKQIKFQFIPKEYIVEFKVNEDENGEGRSVLTKALFYAKLYLALLIFKMVTIITKSNDTRVYYVKNSGMEQNVTNKIQEVARTVKSRQINFMDLLNYNSIISKIGANKEIFMPVGRSGDRGIEFDILQGQDVQLNTDLMELLRTNMINGTGVPSVIMNYINEADYAKTIVMGHSKFVGRTISIQLDLNPSISELYRAIIRHSNIAIPEEVVDGISYALNPPKVLNTTTLQESIGTADAVVDNIIRSKLGENTHDSNDGGVLKDLMYNKLIREYLPAVDWAHVDRVYDEATIELSKRKVQTASNGAQQ